MAEAPVLADERVRLAPFLPEHVGQAYVGWLNDADVVRYTEARFVSHTLETARAYVADNLASDSAYLWRILGAEDVHVGNLRLGNIDRQHRRATIALIIGRHSRGSSRPSAGSLEPRPAASRSSSWIASPHSRRFIQKLPG